MSAARAAGPDRVPLRRLGLLYPSRRDVDNREAATLALIRRAARPRGPLRDRGRDRARAAYPQ